MLVEVKPASNAGVLISPATMILHFGANEWCVVARSKFSSGIIMIDRKIC